MLELELELHTHTLSRSLARIHMHVYYGKRQNRIRIKRSSRREGRNTTNKNNLTVLHALECCFFLFLSFLFFHWLFHCLFVIHSAGAVLVHFIRTALTHKINAQTHHNPIEPNSITHSHCSNCSSLPLSRSIRCH